MKNEYIRRKRELRLVKEQLKKDCTAVIHKIIDGSFVVDHKIEAPSPPGKDGMGSGEKIGIDAKNTLSDSKDHRLRPVSSILSDGIDFIVALAFSLFIIVAILPFSIWPSILFGPFVFFVLSHHGITRYRDNCYGSVRDARRCDALSSCGMACCGIFPMCLCIKPYGPYPRCVGFCIAIAISFGGIVGLYMFVEEVVSPSLPPTMWIFVVALVPGLICCLYGIYLCFRRARRRSFLLAKIEQRKARLHDDEESITNNLQSDQPPQKKVQLASPDDDLADIDSLEGGVSQSVHIKKRHHHHKKKKTRAAPDNIQGNSVVTEQPDGFDDGSSVISSSVTSLSANPTSLDQQPTTVPVSTSVSLYTSIRVGTSQQQSDGDDVRSFGEDTLSLPPQDTQSLPPPSRHAERHRLEDERRRQKFLAAEGRERGLRGVGKEAREGKKVQVAGDRPFSS